MPTPGNRGALHLAKSVVGYAQVARGFLMPQNLNLQGTWNYQVGATRQADRFTASGDLYPIDFGNRIASNVVNGTTIYLNGGAVHQGVELEKSYVTVDFAAGYTLPILNGRKLDFRLNVNNIANDHSPTFFNGTAADGKTGLFFTNAGRSVFFSVAASLSADTRAQPGLNSTQTSRRSRRPSISAGAGG